MINFNGSLMQENVTMGSLFHSLFLIFQMIHQASAFPMSFHAVVMNAYLYNGSVMDYKTVKHYEMKHYVAQTIYSIVAMVVVLTLHKYVTEGMTAGIV